MLNGVSLGFGQSGDNPQERLKKAKEARFKANLAHVHQHEAAHAAAAGELGGGIVINADPESGAVSGHVPIRMYFGKTADEALKFASQIRGAALAPGDPSGQDMAVASQAQFMGNALYTQRKEAERKRLDKQA